MSSLNQPTTIYDYLIIGAGAAGLMCAIELGKQGQKTAILEQCDKVGNKILVSGGGRCNFTNMNIDYGCYISANPHFCKSALSKYTQWDFIAMLEDYNIKWHEKELGQLFCDDSAKQIVDMLVSECKKYNVEIMLEQKINSVNEIVCLDGIYKITTNKAKFSTKNLVVATGGPSIPIIGGSDFGLQIARKFNIKNIPFKPALVPFVFSQKDIDLVFKDLAGLSAEVEISCNNQSFNNSMLFTHKGLSGPACLQISSYWKKGDKVKINLLPKVDAQEWLMGLKNKASKDTIKKALINQISRKLAVNFVDAFADSKIKDLPLVEIKNSDLNKFGNLLNNWYVNPTSTEGIKKAEVCIGGVDTNELNPKTMESRKHKGLYFIGEVVDVTGHLGGYNFQWAWSSGFVLGNHILQP